MLANVPDFTIDIIVACLVIIGLPLWLWLAEPDDW